MASSFNDVKLASVKCTQNTSEESLQQEDPIQGQHCQKKLNEWILSFLSHNVTGRDWFMSSIASPHYVKQGKGALFLVNIGELELRKHRRFTVWMDNKLVVSRIIL